MDKILSVFCNHFGKNNKPSKNPWPKLIHFVKNCLTAVLKYIPTHMIGYYERGFFCIIILVEIYLFSFFFISNLPLLCFFFFFFVFSNLSFVLTVSTQKPVSEYSSRTWAQALMKTSAPMDSDVFFSPGSLAVTNDFVNHSV